MDRFGKRNLIQPVGMNQFQDTASRLLESLQQVRDDLNATLNLTVNDEYYNGIGSMTILTDETERAAGLLENQPMKLKLKELSIDLWKQAYSKDFFVTSRDNTLYMITLSNEDRHKNRLLFYGQGLDLESLEVYQKFNKRDRLLQVLDDGLCGNSDFAVGMTGAMIRNK